MKTSALKERKRMGNRKKEDEESRMEEGNAAWSNRKRDQRKEWGSRKEN